MVTPRIAAIGFCLSNNVNPAINKDVLILGIAFAGALGIMLLWIIDVLVYHKLLDAYIVTGHELERHYKWLPPNRMRMRASQGAKGIFPYTVLFYAIPIFILCMVGTIVFASWAQANGADLVLSWVIVAVGSIFFGYICSYSILRMSRTVQDPVQTNRIDESSGSV